MNRRAEIDRKPMARPPLGRARAAWRGAKAGFRRTTYLVGPLAAAMLAIGVSVSARDVARGRGWPSLADATDRSNLLVPFGFYLVSCLWGVLIGAVLGPIVHLARRRTAWLRVPRGQLPEAAGPAIDNPD